MPNTFKSDAEKAVEAAKAPQRPVEAPKAHAKVEAPGKPVARPGEPVEASKEVSVAADVKAFENKQPTDPLVERFGDQPLADRLHTAPPEKAFQPTDPK